MPNANKNTVFQGRILPIEVVLATETGQKTAIVITDHLNEPVARLIEPGRAQVIELVRGLAVELATKYDDGEIDWSVLEEVFN